MKAVGENLPAAVRKQTTILEHMVRTSICEVKALYLTYESV